MDAALTHLGVSVMSLLGGTCLIVGASHAGAQMAISLRREGWSGPIVLIGDEPGLPYQRPPLSKAALQAQHATNTDIYSRAAYDKASIQLMPDTRVLHLDRVLKQVLLSTGETLGYDKLALCTGARVQPLMLPGCELTGVHYLRNAADAQGIRAQARQGDHAVIVGAGYIGLEAAAALRALGMQVTLLVRGARLLERVSAPAVSDYLLQLHRANGVTVRNHMQPCELRGRERVEQVLCCDGSLLPANLVIVGIGVQPNLELAQAAGLTVGNGILVDECAQTSDPDIVAAGDCTFHPNNFLGFSLRLESVPNAVEQAKSAAASICGSRKPYCAVPWFWSVQYKSRLQIAGLNRGYQRVVVQRNIQKEQLIAWYLKDDRIIAADCINSPAHFVQAKRLVTERAHAMSLPDSESMF